MADVTPAEPMRPTVDPEWIPSPLFRLTLEQYEAMVDSGVFHEDEPFHLINGLLVAKRTQNDLHATADELCGHALSERIPPGWHVRAGKPHRIPSQASKPEPDRCVARGGIRDYLPRSPEPADIALVAEISDSSLREDCKQAGIYAGGGVPVYWIVNLVDRRVEVYSDPGLSGYQSRRNFRAGESVPFVIESEERTSVPVNALLP